MKKILWVLFLTSISILILININASDGSLNNQYIIASKINLRTKPSLKAQIACNLIIGTPVKKIGKPVNNKWCKIYVPHLKKYGYTYCEFISKDKPTLKEIKHKVLTAKNSKSRLNFLERQYYLSPSIRTLWEIKNFYQKDKCKMSVCEGMFGSSEKNKNFCVGCKYFKNYIGILKGNDFKPIIDNSNMVNYKDYQKLKNIYYFDKKKYKKLISVLPAVKKSIFKNKNDFVAGVGSPFINKTKIANYSGKAAVIYTSEYYSGNTIINFIEKLKSFPDVKINVSHGKPIHNIHEGDCSICGIGSYKHKISGEHSLMVLTKNKIIRAKIVSAIYALGSSNCTDNNYKIQIAVKKPIREKIYCILMLTSKINESSKYKILAKSDNFWIADLNNDNIADIAGIININPGEISRETVTEQYLFVNISGTWMLTEFIKEPDCT